VKVKKIPSGGQNNKKNPVSKWLNLLKFVHMLNKIILFIFW